MYFGICIEVEINSGRGATEMGRRLAYYNVYKEPSLCGLCVSVIHAEEQAGVDFKNTSYICILDNKPWYTIYRS